MQFRFWHWLSLTAHVWTSFRPITFMFFHSMSTFWDLSKHAICSIVKCTLRTLQMSEVKDNDDSHLSSGALEHERVVFFWHSWSNKCGDTTIVAMKGNGTSSWSGPIKDQTKCCHPMVNWCTAILLACNVVWLWQLKRHVSVTVPNLQQLRAL